MGQRAGLSIARLGRVPYRPRTGHEAAKGRHKPAKITAFACSRSSAPRIYNSFFHAEKRSVSTNIPVSDRPNIRPKGIFPGVIRDKHDSQCACLTFAFPPTQKVKKCTTSMWYQEFWSMYCATTGIERRRRRARALEGPRSGKFGGFGSRKPDFHHKIVVNLQVPRLSRTPFR